MGAEARGWLWPAALGVGAITLARVILLAFNQTDLFVDEAQYWLWGQELALGYYSKPPMIGWVIRLATEIGGHAPFWVRLPAPLFHGATALILGALAARLFGAQAGLWTALAFVTTPMVALGSLLISTDTIMFPFLALAVLGYLRVAEAPSLPVALWAGAALGLAFLSKYAALYLVLCAALSALVLPRARLDLRMVAAMAGAFLLVAAPNLAWNLANGLTTVQHTLDNVDWVRDPGARAGLRPDRLAEFFFAQFAVFGPVLFAGLLIQAARWQRLSETQRHLLLLVLPIVALVCVQALLSRAYANWAVAAYLAGVVLVVPWLRAQRRVWLWLSFAVNGGICLLFPIAATVPEALSRDGQPLLNRYIGRAAMSEVILDTAKTQGLSAIVATDRDILADLFYTARTSDVSLFAAPEPGRPRHYYAQRHAFSGSPGRVLFVASEARGAPCPDARPVAAPRPETGAYRRHAFVLYEMPAGCLGRGATE